MPFRIGSNCPANCVSKHIQFGYSSGMTENISICRQNTERPELNKMPMALLQYDAVQPFSRSSCTNFRKNYVFDTILGIDLRRLNGSVYFLFCLFLDEHAYAYTFYCKTCGGVGNSVAANVICITYLVHTETYACVFRSEAKMTASVV